jgi:hypothetical protein
MSLDVREEVWELACTIKDSGRMVGERGFFLVFRGNCPQRLILEVKKKKM